MSHQTTIAKTPPSPNSAPKSRAFTLPGRKRLASPDYQLDVVVVDVTESPILSP